MAVYERNYRPYEGALTASWSRFSVLPRYAYQSIFESKLLLVVLVLSVVPLLANAIAIYIPHNSKLLARWPEMQPFIQQLFSDFGPGFFLTALVWQFAFAFLLNFLLGPSIISADLRNNGLPLYFARPFSRAEYVLGKSAILLFMMSAVSWIPVLLLYLLKAYFAGFDWIRKDPQIPFAIVLSSLLGIGIIGLVTLSISAYVKWKPVARLMLLIIFLVFAFFATLVNGVLNTTYGSVINLFAMWRRITLALFGTPTASPFPLWLAWTSLILASLFFLWLLNRKLRAYEVVS